MKKLLLLSLLAISSFVYANSWAPTLADVVALYDITDQEFSPFLFHSTLDELFPLKMDPSCAHISVNKKHEVTCLADDGSRTIVGSIDNKGYRNGYWKLHHINWLGNVEIVARVKNKALVYSLSVK
ncbi:MAG: hypothetical protein AB7I27_15665 [Bacteriovoracaceae bacterium]